MFQFDMAKFGRTPATEEPAAPGARAMSVSELLVRLWRGKYWALAGAVVMVAAALLFSAVVKPSYESSALIYIDPQDLQLLQNDISSRPPTGDSGAMFVESQSRIMQSAEVMRDVVDKLHLATDPEFASKTKDADASGEMALQGTIDNLSSAVHVVHADRTYVIEIYARSEDAQKAARIANAVVDSYLSVREAQRVQQASTATASIERRLGELRNDLTAKEQAVDQFKAANGIVAANGQSLIENRLNDANTGVSNAQRAMDEARTRMAQLDLAKSDPIQFLSSPEAMASPDLVRLRGEYDQAMAELQTETATLGPKHPTVVRSRGQVNSVSRSITTTANRLRTSAKLEYDSAVADYNAAIAALKTLTTAFQSSDSALVQMRQLVSDADSSRAVYQDALLRSRQTREQEQVNTANVQVISQATAPIQKRFPPRLTVLIPLAIALGLAVGTGLSLLSHLLPVRQPRQATTRIKLEKADKAAPAPVPASPAPRQGGLRRYAALPDRGAGNHVR
jgi:succinoglycan biosynthesis transport protein ExoP